MSAPSTSSAKPVLQGVRIKTRKGDKKSKAKLEPTVFRDSLIEKLAAAKPESLEEISQVLDAAANTLDYHRYGETLFEVLITGGILSKWR